jgi:uncharacterized protein (TIGR02284 family)
MNNLTTGQRITSPEGSGEILTTFEEKVVIKLDNGKTTTLPAAQVSAEYNNNDGFTDLTKESPEVAEARAEHAGEIVAKLDHLDNENYNRNNEQIPTEMLENSFDVINDLIKINNDRVAGFEKAAADLDSEDTEIIAVFNKLAAESQQYVTELTDIIQQYGGEAAEGTSTSGDLHRAWIDIKATFTGSDLLAVLNECERGEDVAKAAYRDALDPENELTPELAQVLRLQQQGINEGHDLIKSFRDKVDKADDIDETPSSQDPGFPINNGSVNPASQEFTSQPTYEGAAGEYDREATLAPEPESIAIEEDWQDEPIVSTTDSKLMEFFVNELKDLLWAERELAETLPEMVEAATSDELKEAFNLHLQETYTHVSRLEQIFGILGLEVDSRKCDAMAGILDEGDEIISATEEGTAQRDVGLIFAGQKAEHYEIASYGGMIALAKTLGYYDIAETLVLTLDEEKTADAKLTEIAENQANYQASTEPVED